MGDPDLQFPSGFQLSASARNLSAANSIASRALLRASQASDVGSIPIAPLQKICRFIHTSVRTEVRSISIALVPTTSGGLARSHHQVTMNLFGSKRQDPPFSLLSRTRSRENRNARAQSFSYGRLQKRALAAIFPWSYVRLLPKDATERTFRSISNG